MSAGIERNQIKYMQMLDATPLVTRLPRSALYPDPENRKERKQEVLEGIAASMLPPGRQLQPCLVWENPHAADDDGEEQRYQIIVGEGRWLAAGINEKKTKEEQYLDCIIVEGMSPAQMKAMQIVENIQRDDPTPMQLAVAYRSLLDTGEYKTNKAVADATGVSEATVSVYLAVLDGLPEIAQLVTDGIATMDTARTVNAVAQKDPAKAAELVKKGREEGELKRKDVRPVLEEVKGKKPAAKDQAAPSPAPAPAPSVATAAPAPQSGPVKRTTMAPAAEFPGQPAPVDKALIPVPATRIHVNVFGTSDATDTFNENVKLHGAATLADDVVHSDNGRAWIRFGDDANNHMMSVQCIDLEIVRIVRRD
jgi:ParB/RepB/Spo0J family partition protein